VLGQAPGDYPQNIRATFRVGGGSQGNLPEDDITVMQDYMADIEITASSQTTGGTDQISLAQAIQNLKNYVLSRDTIATADDAQDYALNYDGVAKARSMAIYGLCRVAIVPDYGTGTAVNPSSTLKTNLETAMDDLAILGLNINVVDPVYVPINISYTAYLQTGAIQATVQTAIENLIDQFFRPANREFMDTITVNDIYKIFYDNIVTGLKNIVITKLATGSDTGVNIIDLNQDRQFPSKGTITGSFT